MIRLGIIAFRGDNGTDVEEFMRIRPKAVMLASELIIQKKNYT